MKSIKIQFIVLLILAAITLATMHLMGAVVTIEGKGRGTTTVTQDGGWQFRCDNSTNTACTLTVTVPEQ